MNIKDLINSAEQKLTSYVKSLASPRTQPTNTAPLFAANYLKNAVAQLPNDAQRVRNTISSKAKTYMNLMQQKKQTALDMIKKDLGEMYQAGKFNLGIPEHLNDPLRPDSALGKLGKAIISMSDYTSTKMPGHQLVYDIPKKYGTQSGELIAEGIKQTGSGQPSNLFGLKIPSYVAGPSKVGLGVLGFSPTMIASDYVMEGAESLATPIFGKDSLATTGIALGAGLLIPGGEAGDVKKAEAFTKKLSELGSKELKALPKEERLAFLVNYGKDLLKAGYKTKDIEKLSAPTAFAILKHGVTPATWASRAKNIAVAEQKTTPMLQGAKESFQKWVNYRKASDFEALAQKKAFAQLDNQGLKGIIDFQAGKDTGLFGDVKKFFDAKYQEVKNAGIDIGYKEKYLPQLWNNTQEEIEMVFGKTLKTRPGFSFESTIKDYVTGMEKGLTPKYTKISDLAASYEKTADKALADKEFFSFLTSKKFILPESKSPVGWQALDADLFPRIAVKIDDKVYSGVYKAEPELAKYINNYLRTPEGSVAWFAKLATRVKNVGFGGGIPGTAINYHGVVNVFRRDLLASSNPISTFFRDIKWIAKPNTALDFVNSNLDDASYFAKHGLTISAEDWDKFRQEVPKGLVPKIEAGWEKWMGDPLFKKTLPAIKLNFAKTTFNDLKKSLPEEQAAAKASEIANNVFGGINLDELGRSKEAQNFLRAIFLAPDWAETNVRVGMGVVKGLVKFGDPELKTYRIIARNMVFNYVLENVANKIMSGHWMFENQGTNNKTAIDTGTFDANGQKRYFTPWGTAQDFVRVPYQIVAGIAQGNLGAAFTPIKNRFSLPLSMTAHLIDNQDFLGRPIYGKDNYGNPLPVKQQIWGVTNEILTGLGLPPQLKGAIDWVGGRSSSEQAVMQSLEAPIKYSGGAYSQKQIQKVQDLKSVGLSGKEINQTINKESVPTPSLWDKLSGKKETTPTDPLMIALQREQDLSDKQKAVKDIFAMNLSIDQTEKLLAKDNLGTYQEAGLYMMTTLQIENGSRPDYIKQILTGMNSEDYTKTMKVLATNKVLTTGVTKYWNDNGDISDDQKTQLDNMIKVSTGKKVSAPASRAIKPSLKKMTTKPLKLNIKMTPYKPVVLKTK